MATTDLGSILGTIGGAVLNWGVHQAAGTANGNALMPIANDIGSAVIPGYVPVDTSAGAAQTTEVTPAQLASALTAVKPHIENLLDDAITAALTKVNATPEEITLAHAAANAAIASYNPATV